MTKQFLARLALGTVPASAAAAAALSATPAIAATPGTSTPSVVRGADPMGGPYSPLEYFEGWYDTLGSCQYAGGFFLDSGQSSAYSCRGSGSGFSLYLRSVEPV
jgi:hypothetical protein